MGLAWLDVSQREESVSRLAESMATRCAQGTPCWKGRTLPAVAGKKRKASAQAALRVTSGSCLLTESSTAHFRKLCGLIVDEVMVRAIRAGATPLASWGTDAAAVGRTEDVDLLTGAFEFLDDGPAEEQLEALLAPGAAITRIRLSGMSFGRDSAAVAARGIANVAATLTDADISGIMSKRGEALDVLRVLCGALAGAPLRRLNLSNQALGEKGVRACAAAFEKQAGLRSITLENVGCSIHACRALNELLTMAGELRQVHLVNNLSLDAGAEAIAQILSRAPLLEELKFVSSRVGPTGFIALTRGLSTGNSLVRLDLSNNRICEEGAPALTACLARQPGLRYLNLSDTSLGDKGIAIICAALAVPGCAPLLKELELGCIDMTPEGAKCLALALAGKMYLSKVVISENQLEDVGLVTIAHALARLPDIRVVDAVCTQMGCTGALALAHALAGKPHLELLALNDNAISDAGVEEVIRLLTVAGKAVALGPLYNNDYGAKSNEE